MTNHREVLTTNIPGLKLLARGKVRDVYEVDAKSLLIVATDRVSAFDVVMPRGVPGRGILLTEISKFWFRMFEDVVPNHILETDVAAMPGGVAQQADLLAGRTMLVKRAKIFPIECVVRGYVAGTGWKDYLSTGSVCGIELPKSLKQSSKIDTPIFTPATKAAQGEHDENISFDRACDIVGRETGVKLRDLSLDIYRRGRDYAAARGIILADTKFEFGTYEGKLMLCDEVMTPDSSRFWDAAEYREGISPPSFDKQILRDWLETQPWDKSPPAPMPTDAVIERTYARYAEVVKRLKG